MAHVVLTQPSDHTTADVADVNDQTNAIVAQVNGNLDDTNIASLSGTKITAGTIPDTAMSTTANQGWHVLSSSAASSVTYNGNRSYTLVYNGVDLTGTVSNGMRLKTTRTVSAPTQCTSLNGTTQYYSKSSPAGMTFTDDFVVSAWVKLNAYGTISTIISRFNGTSGWGFDIQSDGTLRLVGFNGGGANFSQIASYQVVPLNRWVHVAAQLDMSGFNVTPTGTISYIMIDGVDVPAAVTRAGTNPTALIQAGNLEIGSRNSGTNFFNGKLAQVAIFNAKVTEATMQGYISQGLAGTETSLISAFSFNGSINDLNVSNANNLSAQASAVATSADSPFTQNDQGTPSGTTDFAILTSKVFSTNTTLTVQVPEGCTIPTSGGVSAISYSVQKVPYGFPTTPDKWTVKLLVANDTSQQSPVVSTWYNPSSVQISIPIGGWRVRYAGPLYANSTTTTVVDAYSTLSTSTSAETDIEFSTWIRCGGASGNQRAASEVTVQRNLTLAAQTVYYLLVKTGTTTTSVGFNGPSAPIILSIECAYL